MKHQICNGDWELFRECWGPGIDKLKDIKEGIKTYEEAFIKTKNILKNSDSFSENQIIEFIELCIELYKTYTGQIDFDGDEMKNKYELNSTHSHFNKLKFFHDLNEGFGKNLVYDKLYEKVAADKKIQFLFNLRVKKISDEYLDLNHKSLGEFEGSYKVYNFEDVFRSYSTNDKSEIEALIRNPCWDASFNYDETPKVSFTDLTNTELTENICLNEDRGDYEECEPDISVLFKGDFYADSEFEEQIEEDNLEKIYDQFKITEVNATLTKVYFDSKEYNTDELTELFSIFKSR